MPEDGKCKRRKVAEGGYQIANKGGYRIAAKGGYRIAAKVAEGKYASVLDG
jgi:hypothetical protein